MPSNPTALVRSPAGSGIFICILRLVMCPLYSVLCCIWRWPWHSADHILRGPTFVLLSSVLVHSLAPPTVIWPRTFSLQVPILSTGESQEKKAGKIKEIPFKYVLIELNHYEHNTRCLQGWRKYFTILVYKSKTFKTGYWNQIKKLYKFFTKNMQQDSHNIHCMFV